MRRDKKAAKKKKSRAEANRAAKRVATPSSFATALKLALASGQVGPAFMTGEWRSEEPRLVNVVVTRVLPNGSFFAHCILVDRTCLGVKNAFSTGPMSNDELNDIITEIGSVHDEAGIGPVSFEEAQAVVFHAIDYAKSLGFAPHDDFEAKFLAPRPDTLADTPLAKPKRPFFTPGQEDDVEAILEKLEEAVGADGFDFGGGEPAHPGEAEIQTAVKRWGEVYGKKVDHGVNIADYAYALAGGRGKPFDESILGSSLAFYWGMFFRPLAGGKTGIELALADEAMKSQREGLERLAQTRASLFDVTALDDENFVAKCKDVFDGTSFDVRLTSPIAPGSRGFAYLTPLPDGTWFPPTALVAHADAGKLDTQALLDELNTVLRELGTSERVDAASPGATLRRFGPLFQGILVRRLTKR